jgi:hypothetical protein
VQTLSESVDRLEFAVRGRPYQELFLDIIALGGLRVNTRQNEAFKKAHALYQRVEANGGQNTATDADITEMQRMHRELEEVHPDLYQLRQKALADMGKGGGNADLSDLKRKI